MLALCVQKMKQRMIYLKVTEATPSLIPSSLLDGESDTMVRLVSNCFFFSLEVNYKIVKKKLKIEEKMPM